MAIHLDPRDCDICQRLQMCDAGTHPGALLELPSGWAVLGDSQQFEGYCLLLSRAPATELHELSPHERRQLMDDLALLSHAVWNVTRPHKLNYEALGNVVSHLHWHVFPRRLSDAQPLAPVWTQQSGHAAFVLGPQHDALKNALRAELERLMQLS